MIPHEEIDTESFYRCRARQMLTSVCSLSQARGGIWDISMDLDSSQQKSHIGTVCNTSNIPRKAGDVLEREVSRLMRFSFYTSSSPTQSLRDAVKTAILEQGNLIGQNVSVTVSNSSKKEDGSFKVDFGVAAKGEVDVDNAIDAVTSVDGVESAIFRVKGEVIRATITGPHPTPSDPQTE